jgi:hypothetical protein
MILQDLVSPTSCNRIGGNALLMSSGPYCSLAGLATLRSRNLYPRHVDPKRFLRGEEVAKRGVFCLRGGTCLSAMSFVFLAHSCPSAPDGTKSRELLYCT